MAEEAKEINVIDLYNEELKGNLNLDRDHPEKFMATITMIYPENLTFLEEHGIYLRKSSKWKAATVEPQVLQKVVLRAKDLGFLDAYVQNPSFLTSNIDDVVKRMAKLDSLNVKYVNEKGKYLDFVFSKRAYDNVIREAEGNNLENNGTILNIEFKETADRVMETFNLTQEAANVYAELAKVEKEGLGLKESILKVFAPYSDNLDYLENCITEILSQNEEEKRERA